ncbi:MAG: copper chaperone PCu(A)C [Frankiales bacterium]|nr:copper chaperone PCu(A)C [Frankiales bacterium]
MALVAAVSVAAAGCGAGRNNETNKERSTPFSGSGDAGAIAVRAVRLVPAGAASSGAAATPGTVNSGTPSTAQAYLTLTIVNTGQNDDALTNATIPGGQIAPSGAGPSSLALPAQGTVQFGDPDTGSTGAALAVSGLSTPLLVGTVTRVTLTFQSGGSVTVQAPVMSAGSYGGTGATATVS